MIAYLKGTILKNNFDNFSIIEVSGIGYGIKVLPEVTEGELTALYIHEHIREDTYDLYGFSSQEELIVFRQMIAVSGIGPKMALAVMKKASINEMKKALTENNLSYFQSISGVGKKLAQKIIIELKDKIGQESDLNQLFSNQYQEIKSALDSLGFKSYEYTPILQKLPGDLKTSEEQLMWALKHLRKK